MIIRMLASGRGIGGAIDYVTHDARKGDTGAHPTTSNRVTWTKTFNSPTDDPELTGAVMRGIVRDAALLKAMSGISARGRKLKNRLAHFVVSWEAGRSVSPEHVETVCRGLMKKLKVDDHVAVAATHNDTEHPHVHLLICTVNPSTGRAERFCHADKASQAFAAQYERDDGTIVVPVRQQIEAARDAEQQAIDQGDVERKKYFAQQVVDLRRRRRPPLHPSGRGRQSRMAIKVWGETYQRERTEGLDAAARTRNRHAAQG